VVVKGRAAECGAGYRRQRRERNYFDGLEEQMRGAIAPHRLECDEDAPVGPAVDAVLDERGAEEIAAELLKAGTIVGGTRRWRGGAIRLDRPTASSRGKIRRFNFRDCGPTQYV
jgi:hypothetical protein